MSDDKISAETQYCDLVGNISIDDHPDGGLLEFAKKKGIDTKTYFPISIHNYKEEDYESIKITTVTFASSNIELNEYLASNPGPIPVIVFNIKNSSLNDYLSTVKRFSLVATENKNLIGHEKSITEHKSTSEQ